MFKNNGIHEYGQKVRHITKKISKKRNHKKQSTKISASLGEQIVEKLKSMERDIDSMSRAYSANRDEDVRRFAEELQKLRDEVSYHVRSSNDLGKSMNQKINHLNADQLTLYKTLDATIQRKVNFAIANYDRARRSEVHKNQNQNRRRVLNHPKRPAPLAPSGASVNSRGVVRPARPQPIQPQALERLKSSNRLQRPASAPARINVHHNNLEHNTLNNNINQDEIEEIYVDLDSV